MVKSNFWTSRVKPNVPQTSEAFTSKLAPTFRTYRRGSSRGGSSSKATPLTIPGIKDTSKVKEEETLKIDPKTGKPFGEVTPLKRFKRGKVSEKLGIGSLSQKITRQREILRTKQARSIKKISEKGFVQRELGIAALTIAKTGVDFVGDVADFPETVKFLADNPEIAKKIAKDLPKTISKEGKKFGNVLRTSPTEALVQVGTEIALMKGTGKAIGKLSKVSTSQLTKLNPKYVGKAKIGQTFNIKTGKGKVVQLEVVGKIPKESLKSQVSKAGRRVTAISSQADELLKIMKKKRVIRKPIPGEEGFNAATKKLLKQFDEGTISKAKMLKLDKAVQQQGAKGLLERSFFADPSGKVRPSRLGVIKDKKGSILDYFTEDITFRKQKPQILLFEDIKIERLPKSLTNVAKKLKMGKSLTKLEADDLLQYQLKKSGKFKSVGFLSQESEISLAPGEILKKGKKVGVTVVEGRKVPIIKAEVFKPKGKIKVLLKKFKTNKIKPKEIKELDKLLKKKTGFTYGLSSSKKVAGKYVSVKKISAGTLSKLKPSSRKLQKIKFTQISKRPLSKRRISKKRLSSKKLSKKRLSKKIISPKRLSKARTSKARSPKRPPRYVRSPLSKSPRKPSRYKRSPPSRPPKRPPIRPKKIPPVIVSTKKSRRLKKRKVKVGYYVYEKRGKNKFIKLKGRPLTKSQAKDRLAYRLDNKISRTAKLIKVTKVKKLGHLPRNQKGYFNKYKKNLRNYKIVKGKRIKTPNTYIEKKGRGVISTPGEKRQLMLNRMAKARSKIKKRVKKKKR